MDSELDARRVSSWSTLALYREWRPQLFRDVIGQEHVSRTLQHGASGVGGPCLHVLQPHGTGKTSTARILAKAVNCPHGEDGEPCNNCSSCRSITAGVSLDVIEMDAAFHRGIEEVQGPQPGTLYVPTAGKSRLFIIDEVHMLTGEAFNALLKTLEEPRHQSSSWPPPKLTKVPLTIMSRCQRFDFRRLGRETIREHLRRVAGEKGSRDRRCRPGTPLLACRRRPERRSGAAGAGCQLHRRRHQPDQPGSPDRRHQSGAVAGIAGCSHGGGCAIPAAAVRRAVHRGL